MKTKILLFGLVLLLTASLQVFADTCYSNDDCFGLDVSVPDTGYCQGTQVWRTYSTYYSCDMVNNVCVLDSPGVHLNVDCASQRSESCVEGNLYKVDNACIDGICVASLGGIKNPSSPDCDKCKTCAETPIELLSPAYDVTYNKMFCAGNYVFDNGVYVVGPGCSMSLTDISYVDYLCGNGVPFNKPSNLFAWVYNASDSSKFALAHNAIAIGDNLNRSNVIGAGSETCGTPITNPIDILYNYERENLSIDNLYTFNNPGNYTVFIDAVSGFCGPGNSMTKNTQNYICPWLGGTGRSNYCGNVEGWNEKEKLPVLVPNPDISIAAPSGEPSPTVTKMQKMWTITNTGLGKINITIEYDCGTWTCDFDGYTKGTQIPLDEGGVYPVYLDITINPDALESHRVGIKVTYDDGYGLPTIPSKTKESYIDFGKTIIT